MFITINRGEYTRGHIVATDQDGDTINYSIYQDCNKGNCSIDNKKIIPESLNYYYRSKNDLNESVKLHGTVKAPKRG